MSNDTSSSMVVTTDILHTTAVFGYASGIPNLTVTSASCSMTSRDDNVTGTAANGSATGASIASPIVMFLAGLVGNVLALVVLHRTRTEIRSMMFYTLVAALTWNDLVGICLTSPVPMVSYINGRQMPAVDKLCRFHAFVMVCFGLSTPLIVCTMAIERSLALKCIYFYSKYCTPSSARILVIILWAFVLLFGALPLFGVGSYSLQYPCTWCFLDFVSTDPLDMTYAYVYAILNLLVVVVMIFCNALVMTTLCQVRNSRRKLSSASLNSTLLNVDSVEEKARAPPQHTRRRQQRDVELQMIWLVCAITTIFSVCWVPLMAYIIFSLQSPEHHSPVFGLVAVRLASLNQTINPWIYVILRKSLLTRVRKLCCSCLDDSEVLCARRGAPRYPHLYMQGGQGKPRQHDYVHVRHQLCPSSQFVGQQNDAASLSEGHRKQSKGSGGSSGRSQSKSKGESSKGGGGGKPGDSYVSECTADEREQRGSCGPCSACRTKMLLNASQEEDLGQQSALSLQPVPGRMESCSLSTSPACSAVCDGSNDEATHRFLLPTDGIYVDFFRRVPSSDAISSQDVRKEESISSKTSCRSQVLEGGPPLTDVAAAVVPFSSSTSEMEDHGYGSKVSTDSSRTSSPDSNHLGPKRPADGLVLSTLEELNSCAAPDGELSTAVSDCHHYPVEYKELKGRDMELKGRDMELSSGVFHSAEDVLEDSNDRDDTGGLQRVPRGSCNRSVSGSSTEIPTDSSSAHERSTVFRRQLSTSSGH